MSSGLDKFLEQEQSEGHLDSEGVFTISTESALEKMSRYTLERPSAWILKVVQAAVGLGATTLNGRVERGWATLEIRLPESSPSWDQVRGAISEPEKECLPPLRDLAVGLWALAQGPERSFQLQAAADISEYDRKYPSLRWGPAGLSFNDKGAGDATCRRFDITINRPPAGLLSRVARMFGGGTHFLDEADELRHLAYLLPLDSRIDGISGHHFLRAQTGVKGTARGLKPAYPNPFLWGWTSSGEFPELGLHPRWEEFARHIRGGGQYESPQKWLALDLAGYRPWVMWTLCFDFATLGLRQPCERSEIRWVGQWSHRGPNPPSHARRPVAGGRAAPVGAGTADRPRGHAPARERRLLPAPRCRAARA